MSKYITTSDRRLSEQIPSSNAECVSKWGDMPVVVVVRREGVTARGREGSTTLARHVFVDGQLIPFSSLSEKWSLVFEEPFFHAVGEGREQRR